MGMALLIHFLESEKPLCEAPRQLLGSLAVSEVTCLECLVRLVKNPGLHEKVGADLARSGRRDLA